MNTFLNSSVCPQCGLLLQGMENRCPRCGRELLITPPAPPPPSVMTSASMSGICSNCGLQLPRFQPTCPNCGARITPDSQAGSSWPVGYQPADAPRKNLVTGSKTADIILGFFFVLLSLPMGGIGLLAVPIVYLAYRRKYPSFAVGLGIGTLAAVVLALGALAACFTGLKNL